MARRIRIWILAAVGVCGLALPGCGGASAGGEGAACQTDADCTGTLFCHFGKCRYQDCEQLECQDGWGCIDGLCCSDAVCCGPEGASFPGSCENSLDDDCDGWTDGEDGDCGGQACTTDAECVDADPCNLDSCDAGRCTHEPLTGECCVGDGTFAAGVSVSQADDGAFLSSVDLDGDGNLDLAVGSDNDVGLTVLPGLGNGSFGAKRLIPFGSRPWVSVAGHFTGGALPDLAVADGGNGRVHLLANQSTPGNISLAVARSFDPGGEPYGITAADLDGDGDVDLAVANVTGNRVDLVFLNPDGTPASTANVTAGAGTHWVTSADFDRDGDSDLATANRSAGNLSILLNQGAGVFQPGATLPAGSEPRFVGAVDVNSDRDPDLVSTSSTGNSLSVFLGNGDGSFGAGAVFTLASGSSPRGVAFGDYNGDGAIDLAVADNMTDDLSILFGLGDGYFEPPDPIPSIGKPNSVVTGDFNQDRILDLASCNGGNDSILILLGQGACH